MTENTYTLNVDGIGPFEFRRHTMQQEYRVVAEFGRLSEGAPLPDWANSFFSMVAQLKVLTVKAPKEWDIELLDPLDESDLEKIEKVYRAMRDKEDSFRVRRGAASEGSGEAPGGDGGSLVQTDIQATA